MIHLSWLSKLTISMVDTRKECTHCNTRGHIREKCRFLLLYCTHCNKGGHIREACRLLHSKTPHNNDRPRHTTNMTQNRDGILPIPNAKDGSSQSITLTGEDYNDYLQYQTSRQQLLASSASCTTQSGNSFAYVAQSSSQGQWILDSGASDHIFGNKNTIYTFTTPSTFSAVTLVNGSKTIVKGIGVAHPLPSVPLK